MKNYSFIISSILFIVTLFFSCKQSQKPIEVSQKSEEYKALNNKLAQGWNTWNTRSVLSHVLLPENFAVDLQLQDIKSESILKEALIGRFGSKAEKVNPGPHSYDGSYSELSVEWKNIEVNVKTAATGKDLAIVITPNDLKNSGNLIINPRMIWGKKGKVEILQNGIIFSSDSLNIKFHLISESNISFNDSLIICPLKNKVILSTYENKPASEIEALIEQAGDKLAATKSSYGANSDLYDAMQTVLAWDVIYEPTQQAVISPVSRIWSSGTWKGWVLFDWDTYFASYMYSLDNKELAYANAIAITKHISENGFVPNFASARGKSDDRSQPPVGSFVIWKIYEKYGEKWFLEEVFNELITWNRWWPNNRDIDGYLCWGSNPDDSGKMPSWLAKSVNTKQAAMWESGLDNSPMYDDAVYDTTSHKLLLADVGLISMYIWDCQSLSKIADALGKDDIKKELEERAEKYSKKLQSLYDDETGIFCNKDLVTGELSKRLSPTLFYPLLTDAVSQEQAERMIKEHFYNKDEFWGEWIMPSIARNDKAFEDNSYWRGRIWAPMNFLVYCGIKNYNLPDAQKDLVEKSRKLILKSWTTEKHVYENYNSVTGVGNDVRNSDKFYHWGALLSFITLLEDKD